MLGPRLISWIEKHDETIGCWIDPRQVRPLVQIAVDAGQRKVCEIIPAAVLFG
jgi:hypothetical protein